MRQLLLTDWHLMRWIRLALGVWLGVIGIQTHDALVGILGTFLLWQAVSNTGCCGATSCATTELKKNCLTQTKEVSFEEIKFK